MVVQRAIEERPDADVSPEFVSLDGFDPDQLSGVVRGGDLEHCQLGNGVLTGEIARMDIGSVHVDAARYSRSFSVGGVLPTSTSTTFLILNGASGLVIGSTAVRSGDIVHGPAGTRFDAFLPEATSWIALQAKNPGRVASAGCDRGMTVFRPSSPNGAAVTRRAIEFLRAAHAIPESLAAVDDRESLAAGVTSALRAGLESACRVAPLTGACRLRDERVRRALEFLEHRLEEQVAMSTLCDAVGVSGRTLAYAFQQTLGVAPMAYFRARRFAAARRALLRATPSEICTVTSVATRFGFWHLGRFSVEYRARFSESPSTTLSRASWSRGQAAGERPVRC